jgi:hypothetical protein
MARTQLFISYSRKDDGWRTRVVSHLRVLARARLIEIWDDGKIDAGENWFDEINEAMSRAKIAMLLISSNFLGSDFIQTKEVPRLFRQHALDGMTIYPLLIRYCPWEEVRWLKRIQIRPGARPVASYGGKIDQILTEVAREVAKLARAARKGAAKQSLVPKRSSPSKTATSRYSKKRGAKKRATKARPRAAAKGTRARPTTRKKSTKRAKPE